MLKKSSDQAQRKTKTLESIMRRLEGKTVNRGKQLAKSKIKNARTRKNGKPEAKA